MKERKRFLKSLELVVLFRTEYSTRHLLFYVNYFTSTQCHKLELQIKRELLDLFSKEREREREFASIYLYFATMYIDLVSVFYLKILFLL